MTARPRVDCPVCGRDVALNPSGTIRWHKDPESLAWSCKAAGTLTAEDAEQADLGRLAVLVERYPEQARELVAISTDRKRRASTSKGGR